MRFLSHMEKTNCAPGAGHKKWSTMIIVKLNDANGNVSGRWFLYYNFPLGDGTVKKRFKEYIKPNSDSIERYRQAQTQKALLEEKLCAGFNPLKKKDPDSEDNDLPKKSLIHDLFALHRQNKCKLRKNTYRTYQHSLNAFKEYLKRKNLMEINKHLFTEAHASDFLNYISSQKRGSHNTTRNKHRSTLKMYMGMLVNFNPFGKIKKLKEYREGQLPFKDYMREKIKNYMCEHDPQLYLGAQLQFYCMIRPTELINLRIRDIDFEKWKIRTGRDISKNKKSQYVIIPNQLKEYMEKIELRDYPQHYYLFSIGGKPGTKKFGDHNLYRRQRDILRKFGYTAGYSFYSWKHTGNIAAVEAGLNLKDIQIQNRHHDLNTLDVYLQNMGAYERAQIRNGFPDL